MTSASQLTCGYTVFSNGDQYWIRSVSIPLTEALEQIANEDESFQFTNELPDYLYVESRPAADGAIIIGGVIGVFAFFASWLATKIFDDVYEAKFQPAIKKALGSADQKLSGANVTKSKLLQLGIFYADKNVFILIGIVGNSFDEILESEQMVKTVHRNAVEWIIQNEVQQPIHLYIINRGNVNVEPGLFENLQSVNRYIHNLDCRTKETQQTNAPNPDLRFF